MIINEETVPCWSSGQRSKQKASEIYVSSIWLLLVLTRVPGINVEDGTGVVGSFMHARNATTPSRHRQLPPRNFEGRRKRHSPFSKKLWLQTFRESIRNMKTDSLGHAQPLAYQHLVLCSCWLSQKMKYFLPLNFTYAAQKPPGFLEFLLRIPDIPAKILRHQTLTDKGQIQTRLGAIKVWGFSLCFLLLFLPMKLSH